MYYAEQGLTTALQDSYKFQECTMDVATRVKFGLMGELSCGSGMLCRWFVNKDYLI